MRSWFGESPVGQRGRERQACAVYLTSAAVPCGAQAKVFFRPKWQIASESGVMPVLKLLILLPSHAGTGKGVLQTKMAKSFGIRYYAGAEAPDSYGRPGRDGSFRLLLRDGRTHRAGVGAASAIDADIGIDAVLVVALFDRFNGAIGRTSAAANAIISDLVCHFEIPPHIYVCSYYTQTMSEMQEGISAAACRRAMGTAL